MPTLRRTLPWIGPCLLLVLTTLFWPGAGGGPAASAARKPVAQPNIVLITADDMRADDLKFMPRTRELLGEAGTTFTDAVANYPLCCPARAMLLTGQYSHNNGVRGNRWPYGGHRTFFDSGADKSTLPVWLKAAGYRTGFVGKYLNGYAAAGGEQYGGGPRYVPPGWDDWKASFGSVYRYYCTRMNLNGRLKRFPGTYQTDLFSRLGRSFIDKSRTRRKPFFLWVSHLAPHDGYSPGKSGPCSQAKGFNPAPARRHAGMLDGVRLPHSPARNEADMRDKNSYMRGRKRRDIGAIKVQHQARLQALQALDESVADTAAQLRKRGILDRTVFIFTSDNGWLLGEHRANSKILPYEESLRVPLLVRGPGFPAGALRGQPTGLIDITATAAEVGRATPTKLLDGVSLRALVRNPSYLENRVMPIEAGPTDQLMKKKYVPEWLYRGVRSSRYSYVAWTPGRRVEEEFYDLKTDPYQLKSTHRVSSRALDAMRRLNAQLKDCAGPTCLREFDPRRPVKERAVARDTRGPQIGKVRAPRGWVATTRPTIRYAASDPTDRASALRHWCSQRALGCNGSGRVRLRLKGEGRHHWTVYVADRAQNVASATGRIGVDLRRPRVWSKAVRYDAAGSSRPLWRGADKMSGVASFDVRRMAAPLAGTFSQWERPSTLQRRRSLPRTVASGAAGRTTCWQARARDRVGHVSSWAGGICRSRPVDASALTADAGWRTVKKKGWFAGTAEVARRQGSTLSVRTSGRLAAIKLLAWAGNGQGRLRVTVGDAVVGMVDLSAHERGRRAFRFAIPAGASGTVRATVVSDGLPTWVDSLGVVRAPVGWPAG